MFVRLREAKTGSKVGPPQEKGGQPPANRNKNRQNGVPQVSASNRAAPQPPTL